MALLGMVQPDPVRVQRPARIHPVPEYAATAAKALTNQLLADFRRKLQDSELEATVTQQQWDDLKKEIARRTRICVRERRRTLRNTLKQKLERLIRQQQRHVEAQEGITATVESITDELDGLSLGDVEGPSRAARLRRAISECHKAKATAGKKRLFREATHRTAKTTKALFKRISTKFGDNVVHRLDPIPGAPHRSVHAKADILADAWQPILQQAATAAESVRHVVAWNENVDTPSTEQAAIADAFTEDEVPTALKACKPDKAAGPD
ncbi:hypothetical protein PR001_g20729 [Phytophthora rubi]|uniref:Uncharacterized protein n=1 Tax=Phytophthora rubi TaxID=129364 RepID=A0A6A3JI59_9STRA|nr:hypothetical protein PR001_g20729 [Phytophthora rubi]